MYGVRSSPSGIRASIWPDDPLRLMVFVVQDVECVQSGRTPAAAREHPSGPINEPIGPLYSNSMQSKSKRKVYVFYNSGAPVWS